MKTSNKKSLVNLCIKYLTVSFTILLGVYLLMNVIVSRYLENSFLVIDDVISYEDELFYDDFSSIPLKKFKHADFIIFNEDYDVLFSTNKELNNKFSEEKISMLNNYSNNIYFEVKSIKNKDNEDCILITKIKMGDENSYNEVKRYALLDTDLNVIDGNLFKKKKKLTQDELNYISGKYSDNKSIEKHTYENYYGEERILVFISNDLSLSSYNDTLRESYYLWFTLIPASILIIVVTTFFFIRSINKTLTPLNKKLIIYEVTKKLDIDESEVPTEFKSVVKNLKELVSNLENANKKNSIMYKERNRVISNISHDLKTPLTVIQGYSKAFLDGIVPDDRREKYMKAIYSKATLSSDIIDTLFEFTKLEHPDYQLDLVEVDINEFLNNYAEGKKNEIELEGYNFEYKINSIHETFLIDEKIIKRLFNNILSNSIKYNKKGVTLYFKATISKSRVKVTLADNGVGINKDIIDSAFDPFTMGESSRNMDNSTGLGLSIAKKAVDLHHGTIRIIKHPKSPYKTEIEIIIPKKEI